MCLVMWCLEFEKVFPSVPAIGGPGWCNFITTSYQVVKLQRLNTDWTWVLEVNSEGKSIQPRTQTNHVDPEFLVSSCGYRKATIIRVTKGIHEDCVYGCMSVHMVSYFGWYATPECSFLRVTRSQIDMAKPQPLTTRDGAKALEIIGLWGEGGRKWWFLYLYVRLTHWNITTILRQLICQR